MFDELALNPNENILIKPLIRIGLGSPPKLFNFLFTVTAEIEDEDNADRLVAAAVPLIQQEFGTFMAVPRAILDPTDLDVFGDDMLEMLNEVLGEANACVFYRFMFGDVVPVEEPKPPYTLN